MDKFGPLYEHCIRRCMNFWEALRFLRRNLMATILSVDSGVLPVLGVGGEEFVVAKSKYCLVLNGLYLVGMLYFRPYKSKTFLLLDTGITCLFLLASLNNMARSSDIVALDQVGVYLLSISAWIFMFSMAFFFASRRKLKRIELEKHSKREENAWLKIMAAYDEEQSE